MKDLKRILGGVEAFKKEMKELGVEVKSSVRIDFPRGNVNG